MTVILFRKDRNTEEEFEVAKKHFEVIEQRSLINKREKVLCRYSFLPYGRELEKDVQILGGELINSYQQHRYVADIEDWYYDLCDVTFETWFDVKSVEGDGPFVIKGKTNSRKHNWNTKMFAKDRSSLGIIIAELMSDPFISEQGIAIRKYVPLETFFTSLNDLPITNEWRTFWYKGKFIDSGYYWTEYCKEIVDRCKDGEYKLTKGNVYYEKMLRLAGNVADRIKDSIPFVCIDVAITAEGKPILVELNDGCMSGLSSISPSTFYKRLKEVMDG